MAWLSRTNWVPTDALHASDLNSLGLDIRNWGGNVNGGGYQLSNVILTGSGGFQFTTSPLQITPGAGSTSIVQFDQTVATVQEKRWTMGKDNVAETGANAGSNFEIIRYDDAEAALSTPVSINRATGLISLGSQKWLGPVDGNGQTITNVSGLLTDPTNTAGDIIARGASALTKLAIGSNGQVLTVDTSLANKVKWAAASGGVPDTVNQQVRVSSGGTLVGTRREINFVNTATVTISATDNGASNRVDVSLTASTGGGGMTNPMTAKGDLIAGASPSGAASRLAASVTNGQVLTVDTTQALGMKWAAAGGGSQSPWVANISGDGFVLNNAGKIGIGISSPSHLLSLYGAAGPCKMVMQTAFTGVTTGGDGVEIGLDPGDANLFLWNYESAGDIYFGTANNERMRISAAGNVGIGNSGTTYPDPNTTHRFLIVGNNSPSSDWGEIIAISNTSGSVNPCGFIGFANYQNAVSEKRICGITGQTDGGINSGSMQFYTWSAGVIGERMIIRAAGSVGIGTSTPAGWLQLGTYNDTAALPTIRGDLVFARVVPNVGDPGGIEWKVNANSAGSGYRIHCHNDGGGNFCLSFQYRQNSATWTTGLQIGSFGLPSSAPAAGSKQLWYDPADGNRVKFAP